MKYRTAISYNGIDIYDEPTTGPYEKKSDAIKAVIRIWEKRLEDQLRVEMDNTPLWWVNFSEGTVVETTAGRQIAGVNYYDKPEDAYAALAQHFKKLYEQSAIKAGGGYYAASPALIVFIVSKSRMSTDPYSVSRWVGVDTNGGVWHFSDDKFFQTREAAEEYLRRNK